MTIYGIDISNNNGDDIDMKQVAAEGFSFVFAKVTEGDYFVDPTWPAYRDAAKAAGLLVAGYHYVRGDCDIDAQADLFCKYLGDAPAMLDFEANSGNMVTFWALARALNDRGVRLALSYIPRWYAAQIGNPDLSQVPGLIQSAYVGGSGFAAELYPGDDSVYWDAFCNRSPDILQFTDSAQVAGHTVDANAFAGTRDQLAALLSGQPQGAFMAALTDAQQADLYAKIADLWDQARGPGGAGWAQLGTNAEGKNLTPVDAEAAIEAQLTKLGTQIGELGSVIARIAAKLGAA